MTATDILAEIDADIARLQQARRLLSGGGDWRNGRRNSTRKRVLSAEARAKISAAQKKRWAKKRAK